MHPSDVAILATYHATRPRYVPVVREAAANQSEEKIS
jgi:hypothetical protein